MRTTIFAAVLVAGLSSSAHAASNRPPMPNAFGPVYDVEPTVAGMKGHMMHIAVVQDDSGGQWVVTSKEDAEFFFGPITMPANGFHGH